MASLSSASSASVSVSSSTSVSDARSVSASSLGLGFGGVLQRGGREAALHLVRDLLSLQGGPGHRVVEVCFGGGVELVELVAEQRVLGGCGTVGAGTDAAEAVLAGVGTERSQRGHPGELDGGAEVGRRTEAEPLHEADGAAVLADLDLDRDARIPRLLQDLGHQLGPDAVAAEAREQAQVDQVKHVVAHADEKPSDRHLVDADGEPVHAGVEAGAVPLLGLRLHDDERALAPDRPAEVVQDVLGGARVELQHEGRVLGDRRTCRDLAE